MKGQAEYLFIGGVVDVLLSKSPSAIVREAASMGVPEKERADGSALKKNDRKQITELPTYLKSSCLFQTDVKFLVGFQETPSGTRSLESVTNNTVDGPKIFPRCWALHDVK